jgi:CBS domain-containing protein
MKVAELMRTDVKTVDLDATVGDAITTLADVHVSALPVTDPRGRIVGVVSTTDILSTLSETTEPDARERLIDATPVREIMTPRSRVITPDADVLDAAREMLYLDVHRSSPRLHISPSRSQGGCRANDLATCVLPRGTTPSRSPGIP